MDIDWILMVSNSSDFKMPGGWICGSLGSSWLWWQWFPHQRDVDGRSCFATWLSSVKIMSDLPRSSYIPDASRMFTLDAIITNDTSEHIRIVIWYMCVLAPCISSYKCRNQAKLSLWKASPGPGWTLLKLPFVHLGFQSWCFFFYFFSYLMAKYDELHMNFCCKLEDFCVCVCLMLATLRGMCVSLLPRH